MKKENYKPNNILQLYKFLVKNSDRNNQVTMKDILEFMESIGTPCLRETIARYINQLKNDLDINIIHSRGRGAAYYIDERLLKKDEMKMVVDAINSASFINQDTGETIINKLKKVESNYESSYLDRPSLKLDNTKTENENINLNIDILQKALKNNSQIDFDYYKYNKNMRLIKYNDRRKNFNPWGLISWKDRYYIYGYQKTESALKERIYRVDKMKEILLNNTCRMGEEEFKNFDINEYIPKHPGMFTGKTEYITVEIPEKLVGAFIDHFGKQIKIEEINELLHITFEAVPCNYLYGWIMGLGQAKIIQPDYIKEEMTDFIKNQINLYM